MANAANASWAAMPCRTDMLAVFPYNAIPRAIAWPAMRKIDSTLKSAPPGGHGMRAITLNSLTARLLNPLAAVYGPFLTAAAVTWVFVDCGHCKLAWLKFLWVFPGMLLMHLASAVSSGTAPKLPPALATVVSVLLSLAMVAMVSWLVGKGRTVKWAALIVTAVLSSAGAFAAYGLVRA